MRLVPQRLIDPAVILLAGVELDRWAPRMAGDVGHDLHAVVEREDQGWVDRFVSWVVGVPVMVVWPLFGRAMISTGVRLRMPNHVWCEIRARSSTHKRSMQVLGGTIDSGYRGELYVLLHNFGLLPRFIRHGHRYAQVVFWNALRPSFAVVSHEQLDELAHRFDSPRGRGAAGFGSTGEG